MINYISSSFRSKIDALYKAERSQDTGIDPNISDRQLLEFLANKSASRIRATARGHRDCYFGRRVVVKASENLRLGSAVSIGSDVLLDALGGSGITLSENATVDSHSQLRVSGVIRNSGTGIIIGSRSAIGAYNCIMGQGGVQIGDDVLLGPNVTILSENHNFEASDVPIRLQGESRQRTVIEDDVWIGAGVVVLAGTHIGRGSVIAAGAVVRENVIAGTIVGGVPARLIGTR
ncbi:acyltransferase [Rhodococcus sp. NPDC078407]|uniref:acyltransferase n=1 Tax=Rhodococcus sp. NPDC078407 TaxID=3364509 RepID=UPI0037C7E064